MFKSLIDTVSSLLPSKPEFLYQPDLHDISAALLAYSRYQETGDFLIVDHLLEQRIAPEILEITEIQDVSLFGIENKIQMNLVVLKKGFTLDVIVDIIPGEIQWDENYILCFETNDLSLLSVDF